MAGIVFTLIVIQKRRKNNEEVVLDQSDSIQRPGSILLLDEGEQESFLANTSKQRIRYSVHQSYQDTPISEPSDSYAVDQNLSTNSINEWTI